MKVGIGILGGGTVGGALLQYLINERAAIVAKTGIEFEVRRVAVRSLSKNRAFQQKTSLHWKNAQKGGSLGCSWLPFLCKVTKMWVDSLNPLQVAIVLYSIT